MSSIGQIDGRLTVEVVNRDVEIATLLKVASVFLLLLVPFSGDFAFFLFTQALIFGIFALSADLIWGITGVMTFGHAVFFGLGAYLMTGVLRLASIGGGEVYLGLLTATLIPALIGLVIAGVLFYQEVDDMHFTIITLAVAIIAEQTAVSWRSLTGGYDGIIGIPKFQLGVPYIAMIEVTEVAFFYFIVVVTIGAYWLGRRVVASPFGAVLVAIKENEEKARSLGYNTRKYKTYVFALGCGIAGFAGGLYAPYAGFVSPSLLGFLLSTNVLLWILIGGRGTILGAIVGAVFLTTFENILSGVLAFSWSIVIGVILVLVVLLFPTGLIGLLRDFEDKLKRRIVG